MLQVDFMNLGIGDRWERARDFCGWGQGWFIGTLTPQHSWLQEAVRV